MNETAALLVLAAVCSATLGVLAIMALRLKRRDGTIAASGPRRVDAAPSFALQDVFDAITDHICVIDRDFRLRNANKSYLAAVNGTLPELAGRCCYEIYRGRGSPCDSCAAVDTFRSGRPSLRKKVVLQRNDEERHIEISAYPIFDETFEVVSVIEYIRDMTEEAQMLDQRIRSEKMAGIGVMTTGIAHEMNNALSGIAGTASNLLTMPEKYGLGDKAVNRIFSILDAATRATSVMKNLLQFSHPLREETRVMVNVKQLLKKIVTGAFIQEAPDIERKLNFDELLPPVRADVSKIELVLLNIVSNAIRSLQEKKLRCERENRPYKGSLLVSARHQQEMVLVTVTDNGVGIPEKSRSRIFDPFFSTWPVTKGTGLGLSTALHIVEEHGGRIFFESVDDLTTFSILLPIDRKKPATAQAEEQSSRYQQ